MSKRQERLHMARHLAQMSGGDPQDYLEGYASNGYGPWAAGDAGKWIAEYIYYDANHEPYQKSEKYLIEGEDGKQRKNYPQSYWKDGKWVWGEHPEGPIPFQLPQLIAAKPDEIIWFCEGEKDAESILNIGGVATSAQGGAHRRWNDNLTKYFKGRRVGVLPDNDKPGYWHGQKVARALSAVAEEVKIVELGLKVEGQDVTDWINAGGDLEELKALYDAASVYTPRAVNYDDFFANLPMHQYIYVPTREQWPASSVDACLPPMPIKDGDGSPKLNDKGKPITIKASTWLDQNRAVQATTWAPGESLVISDRLMTEGGWINKSRCATLNLYRQPHIQPTAGDPEPWLKHVREVYPNDADHIIHFLAQRIQQPSTKINHCLVLGGMQGIGKDTILTPIVPTVGQSNFVDIAPQDLTSQFNPYVKAVILRINEAHDLGDLNRYSFYEKTKMLIASPPEVPQVNDKYLKHFWVPNVCGVIITTNYLTDGIYLPAEDRRHYVCWSPLAKGHFPEDYFTGLYAWFESGGNEIVADYLMTLDISKFNPKAEPPKTEAFLEIVDANRAPEGAELSDVIDRLKKPDALTIMRVSSSGVSSDLYQQLTERKYARSIPIKMQEVGYVRIRNPDTRDGRWVVNVKRHGEVKGETKRQNIYAKAELSPKDRMAAASALMKYGEEIGAGGPAL